MIRTDYPAFDVYSYTLVKSEVLFYFFSEYEHRNQSNIFLVCKL